MAELLDVLVQVGPIRETCVLDSESIPWVLTSSSIRRVLTLAR